MSNMVMTSIYLTPSQKRALHKRAKQAQTTVSEEIRTALDKHLEQDREQDEAVLSLLAGEANRALDRMIKKLDESHASLSKLLTKRKA
jgi:guanylate kinase